MTIDEQMIRIGIDRSGNKIRGRNGKRMREKKRKRKRKVMGNKGDEENGKLIAFKLIFTRT